jgi:hypothetical protein
METSNSQTSPAPPQLLKTIIAGFDTITNHIGLVLFPIGLDLLIWLAPHLRVKQLIESWMEMFPPRVTTTPDVMGVLPLSQEAYTLVVERFNLLMILRSYPVGIPSLMVSLRPLEAPGGQPMMIDVPTMGNALLMTVLLALVGLLVGALYFEMVARVAIHDELRWRNAFYAWPRASLQVILLSLVWMMLLLGVSIPVSCGMTIFTMVGISLGPIAYMAFGPLLLWIIFPLIFSPHGIFANQDSAWESIKKSIQITRMTLPTTATFFVSVLFLGWGMDMLWRIPPENSWLMLIGIAGHAFVATGSLAASFIYYQQANEWVQSIIEQLAQNTPPSSRVA